MHTPANLHSHSPFFLSVWQVEALPLLAGRGVDGGAIVADPDPGSSAFFTARFGIGIHDRKNSDLGSGNNVPDHISGSLVQYFGLKMFSQSVSSVLQVRIQNPMLFAPGSGIMDGKIQIWG
jgi:hypothetical protein